MKLIRIIIKYLKRNDILSFLSINLTYSKLPYCFIVHTTVLEPLNYRIIRPLNYLCNSLSELVIYANDRFYLDNTELKINIKLFLTQTIRKNFGSVVLYSESNLCTSYIISNTYNIKYLMLQDVKNCKINIQCKNLQLVKLCNVNTSTVNIDASISIHITTSYNNEISASEIYSAILYRSSVNFNITSSHNMELLGIIQSPNSVIIGLNPNTKIDLIIYDLEDIAVVRYAQFKSIYCHSSISFDKSNIMNVEQADEYILNSATELASIYLSNKYPNKIKFETIRFPGIDVTDINKFSNFLEKINDISKKIYSVQYINNLEYDKIYVHSIFDFLGFVKCIFNEIILERDNVEILTCKIKKLIVKQDILNIKIEDTTIEQLDVCKSRAIPPDLSYINVKNSFIVKIKFSVNSDNIVLPYICSVYTINIPDEIKNIITIDSSHELEKIKIICSNKIINLLTKPKIVLMPKLCMLTINNIDINICSEYRIRKTGEYHFTKN